MGLRIRLLMMNRIRGHRLGRISGRVGRVGWGVGTMLILMAVSVGAKDAGGLGFFEKEIRPVLVEHCYECHAVGAEKIGGRLYLDSRPGILEGGEAGPALVGGDPKASLILDALRWHGDLEMPPDDPLPPQVVGAFEEWIGMGAPDPRAERPKPKPGAKPDSRPEAANSKPGAPEEREYPDGALWGYAPVSDPVVPAVEDPAMQSWVHDPLDAFVWDRLAREGLEPVEDASPRVLVRRLYFDLIGLPPSAEEIAEFVDDCANRGRNRTVESLVDRLLESPHFGERWGQHWLDVVRYAESNGNDGLSRNPTFPHAWRYRDYVIDSFNADLPYDRFLTEQLAGDLLPAESPEDRDRMRIATGILALGAKPAKAMNDHFAMDVVADQIDVVSTAFMGLSVACARCHDHKTDPIPTADYYAMAGIFTSTETMWGLAARESLSAPSTRLHTLDATPALPVPEALRDRQAALEGQISPAAKKALAKSRVDFWSGSALAMGARDRSKPADAKINIKGDSKKPGKAVPRGFLGAVQLNPGETVPEIPPGQSGRLQLARWLAHPDHPLTARVMVNRIWQHLFGAGIVPTVDEFGVFGTRPTHPELLDHLALRFRENGWSVKTMIRGIVLSRSYGLASAAPTDLVKADPENRLLARHSRRRLDAESLRDAILTASGRLDPAPGTGSAVQHLDVLVNLQDAGESLHRPSPHRSIYLCRLRNNPPASLAAFDLPAATRPTGRREVNTLPAHGLFLLNNPWVVAQSDHLAGEILAAEMADDRQGIATAFRRTLGRDPQPGETDAALELLATVRSDLPHGEDGPADPGRIAWATFCGGLFASSEFRYID